VWGAVGVLAIHFGGQWLRAWHPLWGLFATLWVVLPGLTLLATRSMEPVGASSMDALQMRAPPLRHAVGALLLAPLLACAARAVGAWERAHLPPLLEGLPAVPVAELSPMARLLLLAISPAVCEELFFRGALLSGMRRSLPWWSCVVWQAVFFGAAHASTGSVLPAALLGAVFAGATLRSRSLPCSMLMHAACNAVLLHADRIGRPAFGWLACAGVVGALAFARPGRGPKAPWFRPGA
jgi:sodium transport system permease protein